MLEVNTDPSEFTQIENKKSFKQNLSVGSYSHLPHNLWNTHQIGEGFVISLNIFIIHLHNFKIS